MMSEFFTVLTQFYLFFLSYSRRHQGADNPDRKDAIRRLHVTSEQTATPPASTVASAARDVASLAAAPNCDANARANQNLP
jgi:hypothetical protein